MPFSDQSVWPITAYYSAPHRLIEQQVWVCGGIQFVRIYTLKHELLATHDRAQRPGERKTHLDHLPPDLVPGLIRTREDCLASAKEVGSLTLQIVQTLLDDPVIDRLHTAGRLLKLRDKFGDHRLEAACQRALHFDDPAYKTVKRILAQGMESDPLPEVVTAPQATAFVRSPEELIGDLAGGESWN